MLKQNLLIVDYHDKKTDKNEYFYTNKAIEVIYKTGVVVVEYFNEDDEVKSRKFTNVRDVYVIDRNNKSQLEIIVE